MNETTQKLREKIDKILLFFEKDRFNLISATSLLTFYILLRIYLEWKLYNRTIEEGSVYVYFSLYNVYQAALFLYLAFFGGVLIISFFSKKKPKKIINMVLWFFWLIVIGTILDFFVFKRTESYELIRLSEIGDIDKIGLGLFLQLLIMLSMGGFYVFYRRRSIILGFLTAILLFLFMASLGTIPRYMYDTFYPYFAQDGSQIMLALVFMVLIIMAIGALVDISNKRILPRFIRTLNPYLLRVFYFMLIALFGIALGGRFLFESSNTETVNLSHLPYAFLVLVTVAFAIEYTYLSNYAVKYAKKKDKIGLIGPKKISSEQCKRLAVLMGVLSLVFSLLLGVIPMVLMLIFIVLIQISYLKFARSSTILGSIFFGFGSVLIFLIGYFTTIKTKLYYPNVLIDRFKIKAPEFPSYDVSLLTFVIIITIFIIGFFISMLVSRYKKGYRKRSKM